MQLFEDDGSEQKLAQAKEVYKQYTLLNELVGLRINFEKILEQVSLLPDSGSLPLFRADAELSEALTSTGEKASQLSKAVIGLNNTVREVEASTVKLLEDRAWFEPTLGVSPSDDFLSTMTSFLEAIHRGLSSIDQTDKLVVINQSIGGQISYLLQDTERYARRIHTNLRGIIPLGVPTPYTTVNAPVNKGTNDDEHSNQSEYSDYLTEHERTPQRPISLLEGEDSMNQTTNKKDTSIHKRRAPEVWRGCFCDSDFLVTLCQDVIQSGSASNPMVVMEQLKRLQAKKASTRPRRDRLINKDRTVDTKKVHKKLENFITPLKRPDSKYLKMIRGNLFK
ncbi:Hypothetical protein GLP15_680 [Giardia lamblia P15]|uniref:Uncharacterized protein n=1 Tax=Giardia intestinalis (strain P15) TaxID=658858 RepID=E1F5E3_GIAIA|nr:Hypothetical protein GLP15_680 [Giardia lamblia P15]